MSKKLAVALVLLLAVVVSACSFSVSTANLSDIKTGDKVTGNEVVNEVKTFSPDTPEIFISTQINNAPDGTELTFSWRYLTGKAVDIDSITLVTKTGENIAKSSLSKPDQGWPKGDYEVVLKLGTDNSKPIHKKFKVK